MDGWILCENTAAKRSGWIWTFRQLQWRLRPLTTCNFQLAIFNLHLSIIQLFDQYDYLWLRSCVLQRFLNRSPHAWLSNTLFSHISGRYDFWKAMLGKFGDDLGFGHSSSRRISGSHDGRFIRRHVDVCSVVSVERVATQAVAAQNPIHASGITGDAFSWSYKNTQA